MKNMENNRFELWLKIIPLSLTMIGILIGVFQYTTNYKRELTQKRYDTTFNIYQDFVEKCAALSHFDKDSTTTKNFTKEYKEFERLYYGKLLLVQDSLVSNCATNFYINLNKFRQKSSSTSNTDLERNLYDLINISKQSLNNIYHEN
jgi:hypothetical protein